MIGILGSNGFLGSYLHKNIKDSIGINRDNYNTYIGKYFNILINANGNSKMYWANANILKDFDKSTVSVYRSINDFKFKKYVYVSSDAVYDHINMKETDTININSLTSYGFHKYLSEQIIKKYCRDYLILRCSALLGENLKKGIVYDIRNKLPLYVSNKSVIQFIDIKEILNIINVKTKKSIINVGGIGGVKIQDIYSVKHNDKIEHREMNIDYLKSIISLKTSIEYVEEYI